MATHYAQGSADWQRAVPNPPSAFEEAGLVLAEPAFLLRQVLSSLSRPVPVPPLRGNSEESDRRRKHVGH